MILNIAIAVMAVILGFSLSMFFLSRKGSEKKVIKNRMAYFAGVVYACGASWRIITEL